MNTTLWHVLAEDGSYSVVDADDEQAAVEKAAPALFAFKNVGRMLFTVRAIAEAGVELEASLRFEVKP